MSTYAHFKADETGQRNRQENPASLLKQFLQQTHSKSAQSHCSKIRPGRRHPFTNTCKPNAEIQTRFFYSSPSGTRNHSGSVQPHLVEREPSSYVQLRRKTVVLAEGASYRSAQHLPLFSQRLHGHLLSLLPSAYVTSPLFASEEYSKNIPPQPPCLSQI